MPKLSFDPTTKLITPLVGVVEVDIVNDLYPESKVWLLSNMSYAPPARAIGGDPIGVGRKSGVSVFLYNGWRLHVDSSINLVGNLYSDDYTTPFHTDTGDIVIRSEVAANVQIVESTDVSGVVSSVASAVWNTPLSTLVNSGTIGHYVSRVLLNIKKFLALK